jgi:Fe-S-cluster containining protein
LDLNTRLLVLDELYRIFDAFINTSEVACAELCDTCCTANVTLTTLEGLKLVRHLIDSGNRNWAPAIERLASPARFRPRLTTNRLATLCAENAPLPDEPEAPATGRCPFLSAGRCPVYAVRPFACRCMVSRRTCGRRGAADMDPLIVTVSNVFMQTIEQVDAAGCSGNLVDVLRALAAGENRERYALGVLNCTAQGLIANHPISVLMVPPEHRARVQPLLDAIGRIRIPNQPL